MPHVRMWHVPLPRLSMPHIPMPHIPMPRISMPHVSMPRLSMPHLSMPRPPVSMDDRAGKALWYGGLAAVAVLGVVEWPVAAVVAAGTYVVERRTREARDHDKPSPRRSPIPRQRAASRSRTGSKAH